MSSNNVRPDDAEVFVAKLVEKYFFIRYFFYLMCALPGIVGFFLGFEKVVYISAGICVAVYLIHASIYQSIFSGVVFLGLAGLVGYLIVGQSLRGACMGVLVVFVVRHLIKELIFRFVRLLIEASKHAT